MSSVKKATLSNNISNRHVNTRGILDFSCIDRILWMSLFYDTNIG